MSTIARSSRRAEPTHHARQGSRDHAARVRLPRCGWAPTGRARSATPGWERVRATPAARARRPGPRVLAGPLHDFQGGTIVVGGIPGKALHGKRLAKDEGPGVLCEAPL